MSRDLRTQAELRSEVEETLERISTLRKEIGDKQVPNVAIMCEICDKEEAKFPFLLESSDPPVMIYICEECFEKRQKITQSEI